MALTKVSGGILQDNLNIVGVITASAFVGDGSGLSGVGIGSSGSINTTGIVTASSFVGDGSGLSGVTTNYYKAEVFAYDNVINSNISVTSSYKTAAIYSDRDLTVDIENGVIVTVDADCYLNIVDV